MVFNLYNIFKPDTKSRWGYKGSFLGKKLAVKGVTKDLIQKDWKTIQTLLDGKQPSQLRQALITADKALDNALRDVVEGDSMGERLKNAKELFEYKDYDNIWKAHKMRNSTVHESGYEPPYFMVQQAVENLKKGLKILGVVVR